MQNINIIYIAVNFYLYFILFEKYEVQKYLIKLSNKYKCRLLYELGQCLSCLNFHLSWILFGIFSIITFTFNINTLAIYLILWLAAKLK